MTLVEVVIAISIMILIATLCFPKDNIEKYQINSFAKQLCSDIRYVRKSNMLGSSDTYIYYKKQGNVKSYILRENSKDTKEIVLPQNVELYYAREKIQFRQDGSPEPAGSTITIMNKKVKKEITIVPISGRVLLKEGKYET
ncbi:pilus assembly FimT family protein [Romboutsia sp.]|uniref:pilus assembly FimT family protein n=1 Tax=Romboutsia sp. TaxID=1965302 RepID=UPI003F3D71DF